MIFFISNSAVPPVHRMRQECDRKYLSSCQCAIQNSHGHIQDSKKEKLAPYTLLCTLLPIDMSQACVLQHHTKLHSTFELIMHF